MVISTPKDFDNASNLDGIDLLISSKRVEKSISQEYTRNIARFSGESYEFEDPAQIDPSKNFEDTLSKIRDIKSEVSEEELENIKNVLEEATSSM